MEALTVQAGAYFEGFNDGWNAALEQVIRKLSTERGDVHEIDVRVKQIGRLKK